MSDRNAEREAAWQRLNSRITPKTWAECAEVLADYPDLANWDLHEGAQAGIGAPCGRCDHGEGHHLYGYVDGTIRWETPCQRSDCDCPGFLQERLDREKDQ